MKTSVKLIHEALAQAGITSEIVKLPEEHTLLLFEYKGVLRAIAGTSPDVTSTTGRTIATNKEAAAVVAKRLGIPVPNTETYTDFTHAKRFLKKYGKIVVKPLDGAHGNGVTTNITSGTPLKLAIARALEESDTVLLQQQVSGVDERVLVFDGKLAAISERVPASVVGDGKHRIDWLIDHENKTNPLRGVNYEKPMNVISEEASQVFLGKDMKLIPEKDEVVQVVGTANIGSGGRAIDRTTEMPEEMVRQAEEFSRAINAFTCGVDFMFDQQTGKWYFIEANTSPSFGLHLWPSEGKSIDVTKLFIKRLLKVYREESLHMSGKAIIGRNVPVDIIGYADKIPAKIDTGADTSAVWASEITITPKGALEFVLFGKKSPHYTGEVIKRTQFKVGVIRSSSGHEQIRYRLPMTVKIKGKTITTTFTLADRSRNEFPILIGRRSISGKFVVDVRNNSYPTDHILKAESEDLNEVMMRNPHEFHEKHYNKGIIKE